MWNRRRLNHFIKEAFKGRSLVVVSNREPYIHSVTEGIVSWNRGGGGLTAVLDSAMQAMGGTWVAWGSGNADWKATNANDTVAVPPNNPSYFLKRVLLTQEEVERYYYGFSNRFFWPLFHQFIERVSFVKEDWLCYKKVNSHFANAVLSEVADQTSPVIWIQDYHLAYVPHLIRKEKPNAGISLFWHIPWPSYDFLKIAPCRQELLESLLCCNLIGFQTHQDCTHFLEAIEKDLPVSSINFSQHTVTYQGHTTRVKACGASIDTTAWMNIAKAPDIEAKMANVRRELHIPQNGFFGIGVDRLEYTKGIIERFSAIDIFLTKYPQFREKFTFLQIASPSRTAMSEYQEYGEKVECVVNTINNKYRVNNWQPIVYRPFHVASETLAVYYRTADIAIISPFADGMNLVAKEFVAAQIDEIGVLLLSQFAGAAQDMPGATLVNPHDLEEFAEEIKRALEMASSSKKATIQDMRAYLEVNNVYKWVKELLFPLAHPNATITDFELPQYSASQYPEAYSPSLRYSQGFPPLP
jgi:trehalose 6-phosphate synthase